MHTLHTMDTGTLSRDYKWSKTDIHLSVHVTQEAHARVSAGNIATRLFKGTQRDVHKFREGSQPGGDLLTFGVYAV